jgi:hypothetical protein
MRWRVALMAAVFCFALPALAFAHLERPSYWPDPAPDTSVTPPAGGGVPKARSLASAVTGKGPGDVRVVCQKRSLKLAINSISRARKRGYKLRPSQPTIRLTKKQAKRLTRINKRLRKQCEFRSVQAAVNAAGNNDRVVIMPGRYTEPRSRKSPVNDPKCNPSMLQKSQSGAETPSYEYQATCGNDQNLIHVAGRAVADKPLPEPLPDRHGIPKQELGECVRCNLQIEGSGPKPEDVILDAGKGYKNPMDPTARPGGDLPATECRTEEDSTSPCWAKHVVLRTDRSDGFVGRNFLMRGAREHGFYTEETDGILLDRVKFFWNADYGHLSFTTDHHMVQNCDGFGSGDAVVYPGAAPQTGDFRKQSFYPERRYNTTIRHCDLRGSAMGYSGSMGNAVRVTRNHFYGNANGLTTDTLSAGGHPGFPADGMKIDRNWFYANNLDIYREDNPFEALVPQPVGTGFFWPGHNDGTFSHNWVFDNWRQGAMLVAIPDEVAGTPDGEVDSQTHCPTDEGDLTYSTSCGNRYFANKMGQVPPGFKPHAALTLFGNETTLTADSKTAPNGVDFWWDEAPVNTGNCWYNNEGPDGTRDSLTADPPIGPGENQSVPGSLPEHCATSTGSATGYSNKAPGLLACFGQWETDNLDAPGCSWWDTPPKPGSAAASSQQRAEERLTPSQELRDWVDALAGDVSYGPQG